MKLPPQTGPWGGRRSGPSRHGFVVILVFVLLASMMVISLSNSVALDNLERQIKRIEQRQELRLRGVGMAVPEDQKAVGQAPVVTTGPYTDKGLPSPLLGVASAAGKQQPSKSMSVIRP